MEKRRLVHMAAMAAVPFVMVLGNSMLIPVFPQLKKAMNLTQFQVGLLVTVFSVPAAVVIPFAGVLSDHIGRRKVIAPALAVYGLGGFVAGGAALSLENPYGVVLAGRIVQGVGAGGTYLLAVALAGDTFSGSSRTKVLGLLEAANGVGKVVSPVLGAAVALIVWWAPFFVYGALALPAALLVWFAVDEPSVGKGSGLRGYGRALARILRRRGVSLAATCLAGMAALFLLFGVLSFLSDELEGRYDIRGFAGGLVLAVPVAAMTATAYIAGTFLQKRMHRLKTAIVAALGVAAASLAAATLLSDLIPFMASLAVLGVAIGAALPAVNMLVTSAAGREKRGVVTSLYGAVRFAGVAVGPPAFSLALEAGRGVMLGGAAACAAFVLLSSWRLIRPDELLVEAGSERPGEPAESGETGRESGGASGLDNGRRNAGADGADGHEYAPPGRECRIQSGNPNGELLDEEMVPMAEHYPPEYLEFIRLFNEGKYAESHRALHGIWSENRSNYFYKALIQMAGALQHWEDQSYYWAANLFRGAARLLSAYAPRHAGLDINELMRTLETCADVADAQRNDRETAYKLPPITLTV